MFLKKGVLKNFENFYKKQLCWSLFLIKLQAKNSFFIEHLWWLLLIYSGVNPEGYLGHCKASMMNLFTKTVKKAKHLHKIMKFDSRTKLIW